MELVRTFAGHEAARFAKPAILAVATECRVLRSAVGHVRGDGMTSAAGCTRTGTARPPHDPSDNSYPLTSRKQSKPEEVNTPFVEPVKMSGAALRRHPTHTSG